MVGHDTGLVAQLLVFFFKCVELVLQDVGFPIVDSFLGIFDVVSLAGFNGHLLSSSFVVHLVLDLESLLLLGLLPGVVVGQSLVATLNQLFLVQARQLKLSPVYVLVFLDEEDFETIIGELDLIGCVGEIDREWEVDNLDVA